MMIQRRNGAFTKAWTCLKSLPKTILVRHVLFLCGIGTLIQRVCTIELLSFTIGVDQLFSTLIGAIVSRKESIERENELKRRDSIFLSSVNTPSWAAQADEEEAQEKARQSAASSWSCCAT